MNNLAITPCVTDARYASRTSRVKRAVGLERTPDYMGYKPKPGILGATLPGRCLRHILILSFGLYGDLPSHNNPDVFFGASQEQVQGP